MNLRSVFVCLLALLVVTVQAQSVVPRINVEDYVDSDIYDVVRQTLNEQEIPDTLQSTIVTLNQMLDRLVQQQFEASQLYNARSSRFQESVGKLNQTIDALQATLDKSDNRTKEITAAINSDYDLLLRLPELLINTTANLAQAKIMLNQWVSKRAIAAARFRIRLDNTRESLVGVDSFIDQLGPPSKEVFNSTLKQILNTHQPESLLQVQELMKLPFDDLDDLRQLLSTMKDLLHEYLKDIVETEANQDNYFKKEMHRVKAEHDFLQTHYDFLMRANKTKLHDIEVMRNESKRIALARVEVEEKHRVAVERRKKETEAFNLIDAAYKQTSEARQKQIELARTSLQMVMERSQSSYTPVSSQPHLTQYQVNHTVPKNDSHAPANTISSQTEKEFEYTPVNVPQLPPATKDKLSTVLKHTASNTSTTTSTNNTTSTQSHPGVVAVTPSNNTTHASTNKTEAAANPSNTTQPATATPTPANATAPVVSKVASNSNSSTTTTTAVPPVSNK